MTPVVLYGGGGGGKGYPPPCGLDPLERTRL